MWFLAHWKLLATLLAAISLFAAGWHSKAILVEAKHNKELAEAQEKANMQSAKTETELETLRANNRRLNRVLDAELKNPRYNCPVPPAGILLRNSSIKPSR